LRGIGGRLDFAALQIVGKAVGALGSEGFPMPQRSGVIINSIAGRPFVGPLAASWTGQPGITSSLLLCTLVELQKEIQIQPPEAECCTRSLCDRISLERMVNMQWQQVLQSVQPSF